MENIKAQQLNDERKSVDAPLLLYGIKGVKNKKVSSQLLLLITKIHI